MKKICLIIALLITYHANSQVVNILSWNRGEVQKNIVIEQPPEYYYEKVIRINTNIPVGGIAGDFRPVIMIDGYTYTNASVLSLKLAWSTKDIDFSNASVSTSGGLSPQIYIKNVAGKAVIYIRNLGNSDGIVNFTITGLLHANLLENYNNNIQPWYSGWYIDEEVDPEYDLIPEIIEGENGPPASALGTAIIYHNEFSGDTKIGGGLTVYGAAAINTATLGSATITGTADLGTLKVNGDANMGNVYARGTVTSGKGV